MTIEEYLSELRAKLHVGPLRKRRILHEIETHLLDAVRQEEQAGAVREEAERRATERLGCAEDLARRFAGSNGLTTRPARVALFVAAGLLAAILGSALTLTSGGGRPASQVAVVDFGGAPVSTPRIRTVSTESGQVTVALVPSRRWRCRPRPCWELRTLGPATGTVAFTTTSSVTLEGKDGSWPFFGYFGAQDR